MDFSFEGLILKPMVKMIFGFMSWVYSNLLQLTSDFFNIGIIIKTLDLIQYTMYGMFVLGLAISLIDYAVDHMDGNKPNAFALLKNNAKAFFVAMFSQKLMLLTFQIGKFISDLISKLHENEDIFSENMFAKLVGHQKESITLIILTIAVFALVLILMISFQVLERNGMFLMHLAMTSFYIISICRGYADPFAGWTKQGIAICFANTLQTLCIVIAFFLFQSVETFFIGQGVLMTASKTERIMQQFAFSSGSRKNASTMINAGMTAIRYATIKK